MSRIAQQPDHRLALDRHAARIQVGQLFGVWFEAALSEQGGGAPVGIMAA